MENEQLRNQQDIIEQLARRTAEETDRLARLRQAEADEKQRQWQETHTWDRSRHQWVTKEQFDADARGFCLFLAIAVGAVFLMMLFVMASHR